MGFHHKFWRNLQEVEKPVLNLVRNRGVSKIIQGEVIKVLHVGKIILALFYMISLLDDHWKVVAKAQLYLNYI